MAVPKQRTNSARTGRRRKNHKLELPKLSVKKDGSLTLPHRVDPETRTYKGKKY